MFQPENQQFVSTLSSKSIRFYLLKYVVAERFKVFQENCEIKKNPAYVRNALQIDLILQLSRQNICHWPPLVDFEVNPHIRQFFNHQSFQRKPFIFL